MYNMLLSIVLPVYNVERFLGECLRSIYSQCSNRIDFEVVAVDDCSPDKSYKILDKYKQDYSNFKVIKHQENKGLGAARNTGFRNIQGEYVWFIDSDDIIPLNAFSIIEKYLQEDCLDILMFQVQTMESNGKKMEYYANFPYETDIISGLDFLNSKVIPHWKKPVTAWSRIQRVDFLKENNFCYPEGVFFEDEELNLKELIACKRMRYVTQCCYYYRVNDSSIMRTKMTPKKFVDKVSVFLRCLKVVDNNSRLYPELINIIVPTHLSVLRQMAMEYKKMNDEERNQSKRLLKNLDYSVLNKYKKFSIKYLLYSHPNLFDKLLWIIK